MHSTYSAGDYAGLKTDQFNFYYGYEFGFMEYGRNDEDERWGFIGKSPKGELKIEWSKDFSRDKFEATDNLLIGIAKFLETFYNE